MFIKENRGLKFQFILEEARKRPGSSVLYYEAREKGFWAALKAWDQTLKPSPLSHLVKMAKFDGFLTKIANIFDFSYNLAKQKFGSRTDRSVETLLLFSHWPYSLLRNFGF